MRVRRPQRSGRKDKKFVGINRIRRRTAVRRGAMLRRPARRAVSRQSVQRTWWHVLEGLDVGAEDVADKTFHEIPGSNIVEKLREKYSEWRFFTQYFLNQITKRRVTPLWFSGRVPDAESGWLSRCRLTPHRPVLPPICPAAGP